MYVRKAIFKRAKIRIVRIISLINLKYIRNIIVYFKYFYNFAYNNMIIAQ